jgi:hypothetical protein
MSSLVALATRCWHALLCDTGATLTPSAEQQILTLTAEVAGSNARAEEARAAMLQMEFSVKRLTEQRQSLQESVDLKQQETDRLAGRTVTSISWAMRNPFDFHEMQMSCEFGLLGYKKRRRGKAHLPLKFQL